MLGPRPTNSGALRGMRHDLRRPTIRAARLMMVIGLGVASTACIPYFAQHSALVAKSAGGASARLIWNQAFDVDSADSIAYYKVEVNGTVISTVVAPASNCTLTGLGSGTHYALSVTAYSNHGTGTEWSGTWGGRFASSGRLSTTFDTPAGAIAPGTFACNSGDADSDGDRLPNWAETNTAVYVSAANTGTNPAVADTDGDGIDDGDETLGTLSDLQLPNMGFKPLKKDLALEFDWFADQVDCAPHDHRPTQEMIDAVAAAYGNSPVTNPDGTTGVHLVADYGQGNGFFYGGNLVDDADGDVDALGTEYSDIKAHNFATNRNGYFHYVLSTHSYGHTESSGLAVLGGDTSIISLECFGSTSNVANTIVHEVGHNLGLRHGGDTEVNFKPNYNSVMNYLFQFSGASRDCTGVGTGALDYSTGGYAPLNEHTLIEANGICGPGHPIDWNHNGTIQTGPIAFNINPDDGTALTTLTDFNDWSHLNFTGLDDPGGAPTKPQNIIVEQPVPLSARHR